MILTKEEFCKVYGLTEEQFYGRETIEKDLWLNSLIELPEGCSLVCSENLFLFSLYSLPERCTLKASYINLESLKNLPENYLIDADMIWCDIILPVTKGSSEFYFGVHTKRRPFKDYQHIKEYPLKYLGSSSKFEKAMSEYFLKNP